MVRTKFALILYFPMVAHKAACHTLSKAFLKSMKTWYRFCWCWRYFSHRILRLKICSVVLLPALNPELVIFSAHRVIMTTFCIIFPEMIFSGFRVMGRTCLILLIRKEHNSIKIVCAVIILVLCTSSNNGLQSYQVSQNGFSYEADTICDGQTDTVTVGQTNRQTAVSSRGGHIFQTYSFTN